MKLFRNFFYFSFGSGVILIPAAFRASVQIGYLISWSGTYYVISNIIRLPGKLFHSIIQETGLIFQHCKAAEVLLIPLFGCTKRQNRKYFLGKIVLKGEFILQVSICLFKLSQITQVTQVMRLAHTRTWEKEWGIKTGTPAARAQSPALMKGCSVSRTEGGHLGPDWSYSRPRLGTGERTVLTELHFVFQAWKAHLMGRGGCKQNSRRPAVSQRSLPAQGNAFMPPPLTRSSLTLGPLL